MYVRRARPVVVIVAHHFHVLAPSADVEAGGWPLTRAVHMTAVSSSTGTSNSSNMRAFVFLKPEAYCKLKREAYCYTASHPRA